MDSKVYIAEAPDAISTQGQGLKLRTVQPELWSPELWNAAGALSFAICAKDGIFDRNIKSALAVLAHHTGKCEIAPAHSMQPGETIAAAERLLKVG